MSLFFCLVNYLGHRWRKWRFRQYTTGRLHVHPGVIIVGDVLLDDNCGLNQGVIIDALPNGRIRIGANVLIGPYTVIRAANHVFADPAIPIVQQGHQSGTILIGDDTWIGAHCVILPGVEIGRGAVVGAGSVVTKDIPPYGIAMGAPAQVRRYRNISDYSEIDHL